MFQCFSFKYYFYAPTRTNIVCSSRVAPQFIGPAQAATGQLPTNYLILNTGLHTSVPQGIKWVSARLIR